MRIPTQGSRHTVRKAKIRTNLLKSKASSFEAQKLYPNTVNLNTKKNKVNPVDRLENRHERTLKNLKSIKLYLQNS